MPERGDRLWVAIAIGVGLMLTVLGGSAIYWFADGAVGTPQQFEDRVAVTGLDVTWSNVGPRGGDGEVTTDCGPVSITVNDIEGELWLTVAGERQLLTAVVVADVLSCSPG